MRKWLIILIFISTFTSYGSTGADYNLLKTGIHFDSKVSGGKYTLPHLADIISDSELDAAIITDHDNMKITYGLKPFENLINHDIEKSSISTYGYDKYFQQMKNLNLIHDEVVLLPGIEAVPYYYWSGSPLKGRMTIHNWHRHLLVFGMNNVEDYKDIPSIANGKMPSEFPEGNILDYIMDNIFHFLLILVYFAGFIISILTIYRKEINLNKNRMDIKISYTSLIFTVVFGIILFIEFPFLPKKYNQYENSNLNPYQEVIDYVKSKDGFVYWAHPEAKYSDKRNLSLPFFEAEIKLTTEPYPRAISQTQNHSGFAIFWEGMKSAGRPGGIWDLTLNQYCSGIRKTPPLAIGELDFEGSNNLDMLNETNTFLFAKGKNKNDVLEALKKGRMYATRNYLGDKLEINDFSIHDTQSDQSAFIGETLEPESNNLKLHLQIELKKNIDTKQISLYRQDRLIRTIPLRNDLEEWITLPTPPSNEITYYKMYIGSENFKTLVTNPIFIKKFE